jgi:carbamoyltransferase
MDLAATAQYVYEKSVTKVLDDLYDLTEQFNDRNLCLSGGSFLNCSFNGKYISENEKWNNVHLMPACGDDGISIGSALYAIHNILKVPRAKTQRKDIMYTGPSYEPVDFEWHAKEEIDTDYKNLAEYIERGNVVAWYNGRSEFGPRALGNRSILFDPTVKDGKDIVNIIKKREWFRPFAGSCLAEKAGEWFDLRTKNETPFMMYAVDVLENKRDLIPAITHVDGTCRVQTVTAEQNKHYYELISEFDKIKGVPILFNTSFNLAGDPLVEKLVRVITGEVPSNPVAPGNPVAPRNPVAPVAPELPVNPCIPCPVAPFKP